MLIYDCDAQEIKKHKLKDEDIGLLLVRILPKCDKLKNDKGIENLLPEIYFNLDSHDFKTQFNRSRDEFWPLKQITKDYGAKGEAEEFQKIPFARWFCDTQASRETMKDFDIIINLLDSLLSKNGERNDVISG